MGDISCRISDIRATIVPVAPGLPLQSVARDESGEFWRRRPEPNRRARICNRIAVKNPGTVEWPLTVVSLGSPRCNPTRTDRESFMSEPTHERGAPSRMRFATCRPASGTSWSCEEHPAPIPDSVGAARGCLFGQRITHKDRMVSRIAPSRPVEQTAIHRNHTASTRTPPRNSQTLRPNQWS